MRISKNYSNFTLLNVNHLILYNQNSDKYLLYNTTPITKDNRKTTQR